MGVSEIHTFAFCSRSYGSSMKLRQLPHSRFSFSSSGAGVAIVIEDHLPGPGCNLPSELVLRDPRWIDKTTWQIPFQFVFHVVAAIPLSVTKDIIHKKSRIHDAVIIEINFDTDRVPIAEFKFRTYNFRNITVVPFYSPMVYVKLHYYMLSFLRCDHIDETPQNGAP